jgi:hypothetical protein
LLRTSVRLRAPFDQVALCDCAQKVDVRDFWNRTADRMLSQSIGFDQHLAKPCDPEELNRVLTPLQRASRSQA